MTVPQPEVGPSASNWPDDPLSVLAQVHAYRQMANLGGFPHSPEWDTKEAEAIEQLGGSVPAGLVPTLPVVVPTAAPAPSISDPFLAFAQVQASRLVADQGGVAHDPSWDATEEAARHLLTSGPASTGTSGEPTAPASDQA